MGGRAYSVACSECGAPHSLPAYRCTRCSGPLVLVLEPACGVERPEDLLPAADHVVRLGEGRTPLLPLPWVEAGGARVHAKLESLNPTLSFKDRAMALGTATALDLGLRGLVLASTGNAAVSGAAYAAAAGIGCRVFCATASRAAAKLDTARSHGALVEVVEGDYSTAYRHAADAEGEGWFGVTTTYRNPLLAESYRPIAAELVADLGRAPDAVVVPVGAGPLLYGVLAGFDDLRSTGVVSRVPRMVGVQAAACAPLATAWASGARSAAGWRAALAETVVAGPTAAGAIADSLRGYEREGLLTLGAVHRSGGDVVAVDETAIAHATRALARHGISAEPAAAAGLAALDSPAARLDADGDVVLLVTGHGAKEPLVAPREGEHPAALGRRAAGA